MSHRLFFLVCALCLSGCQSIVGMQVGPDYDKSKFSPVLEMPPDLLSSGGQQTVPMAALEAGADALVVDAKAEDVWPLANSLLEKAGFTIA